MILHREAHEGGQNGALDLERLSQEIIYCERCPRLRDWCTRVATEKRAAYQDQEYWGRPVPNFGDPDADLLIVGLAPAAHGANRTGRMFTGDRSGEWLYRALHEAGLANQFTCNHAGDDLQLNRVLITAVNHCAPPDNKPLPEEIAACRPYLVDLLTQRTWRSVLCLGGIAWKEVHHILGRKPIPKFSHGQLSNGMPPVYGSYHPSQQNTFTGRLTREMLQEAIEAWATCR